MCGALSDERTGLLSFRVIVSRKKSVANMYNIFTFYMLLHQKVEFVEGSTPSEAQEVMAQEEPGMGSPGHPKS
jgi:hypothetical protein